MKWKRNEAKTAADLGVKRNPSNGRVSSDIDTEKFYIEHKERKLTPEWWTRAWEQLEACPENKTPLLVFAHAKGKGYKVKKYAVLRWEDFLCLLDKK